MIECANMVSACRDSSLKPVSESIHIYQPHAEKAAYNGQQVTGERYSKTLGILKL